MTTLVPAGIAERSARSGPVAGPARPFPAARAASLSSKEVRGDQLRQPASTVERSRPFLTRETLPLCSGQTGMQDLGRGALLRSHARHGDPEIQAARTVLRERGGGCCLCRDAREAHEYACYRRDGYSGASGEYSGPADRRRRPGALSTSISCRQGPMNVDRQGTNRQVWLLRRSFARPSMRAMKCGASCARV